MDKLINAKNQPVIVDACILMVGIDQQNTNPDYSFDVMKQCYLQPVLDYFKELKIHEMVWEELDDERRTLINPYIGKSVELVTENNMYGVDPQYTTIFNNIADNDLLNYRRGHSKNRGEVYSLAYAAYYGIPFFSTRDGLIIRVMREVSDLENIEMLGFEYMLTVGFLGNSQNSEFNKILSSLYKSQCGPAIKQGLIPPTFNGFLNTL